MTKWQIAVTSAKTRPANEAAALPLSSLWLPFCSSALDALHNCAPLPSAVRFKMSLYRPVSQHCRENRRKDTWHSVRLYSGPTRGGTALPISCTSRKGDVRAFCVGEDRDTLANRAPLPKILTFRGYQKNYVSAVALRNDCVCQHVASGAHSERW
nr:uncharacterized protein LOC129381395 isoform X3 [Dermacentor andersoni]